MKLPLIYHPGYSPEFDANHRFPMEKFARLYDRLENIGLLRHCELFRPEPANEATIRLAHHPDYVTGYRDNQLSAKAMRRIGLPWSEGVMRRTFLAVGGSLLSTELALERGLAAHLAGGTHHAHYQEGSGFCIFNDLAICARHALTKPGIDRVLIIDTDVHQGDGTARILDNDPDILTVSFHCRQNFPARKAHSNWDFELDHQSGDQTYLNLVHRHIPYLLDITEPDLVLYDAGADVHQDDALGLLNLTDDGIYQRDVFILSECAYRNIPVSCVIGGGYMKDRKRLAEVHSIIHQAAFDVWREYYQR
ncbi:histone deacetylase [Reinekea blandensis]|uniref:Deacetylase, including yeast histone deacetylase and acetoin utilization protein n=1 Tax=Reinekea blandensis MED297 TaxID=314283 RepID=A4BGS6_9GAMM|nr:histone deacetylase [Reinekea blandensis]EAR08724.1 Deacetylase, including yeast histone deacetylase and acetoin utilization protein [Reinekea sp. MED297] [Reinekea blandensis MED297]